MVAEPVSATVDFLRTSYDVASDFVATQSQKLPSPEALVSALSSLRGEKTPPSQISPSIMDKIMGRIRNHRFQSAFILASGLAVAGIFYRRKAAIFASTPTSKRRARKLANGARCEVVLVVGSPTEPLTRLLALDFERRGFIVYLTILDEKDAKYVHSNTITDDLHYLDVSGNGEYEMRIAKFAAFLREDVVPIQGAQAHKLRLAAVVFPPQLYFPVGPLENVGAAAMDKVMARTGVCTRLVNQGLLECVREHGARIVALVPTIVSTLGLAYHGPEAMFQACMKQFYAVLAKELRPQGIYVTQVRMGNLNVVSNNGPKTKGICDAEVRSWDPEIQSIYGASFVRAQRRSTPGNGAFASHGLRGLHHLLFDLVTKSGSSPSCVYYGAGARMYEWISALPGWILEVLID